MVREVRISCMGHLAPLCMFFSYLENQFYEFSNSTRTCLHSEVSIEYVTALVSLSRCSCKHFTILGKNITGSVASSYQVNLEIEIPNITENYINSHIFTCHHWVSGYLQCLFKYRSRCLDVL